MKTILLLLLLAGTRLSAAICDLAITLMPTSTAVTPGQVARLDVVAINPRTTEAPFDIESTLAATLRGGARTWPVTLVLDGISPKAVHAGAFAASPFRFEVPVDLPAGDIVLEVKGRDDALVRATLEVTEAAASLSGADALRTPLDLLVASAPAMSALTRNFAGRFMPNQPIYFIAGGDPAAKFQFSFDYRLATLRYGAEGHEHSASLLAGYTQRSLWRINKDSSPFYDTSYMPELAISSDAPMPQGGQHGPTWLQWRAGVLHESNGKEGLDSRSANVVYFSPRFLIGAMNDWFVGVVPEVQAYVGGLSENPDLKNYRGYGKLRFILARNDGPSLMFTGWAGKDFNHASFQLDLAVPARVRLLNIEAYLYAQYFNGYGESLRDYRAKTNTLRLGFALVR